MIREDPVEMTVKNRSNSLPASLARGTASNHKNPAQLRGGIDVS